MAARDDGLRLLSLDGGGIRGLFELLLLEEIMKRIQHDEGLSTIPFPCDYFDLIGGTSTGGLVAIMLGRLRMPIGEAIAMYASLGKEVFSERKRKTQEGNYKASNLTKAIKRIVAAAPGTRNEDELMMETEGNNSCKVQQHGHPYSLSHLPCRVNASYNCAIWEAVRATFAAPAFFKPIEIGIPSLKEHFVDGSLRCNNPIAEIIAEAHDLWPDHKVACLLSLGTGHANTIGISTSSFFTKVVPLDVAATLNSIATDCEKAATECDQRFPGPDSIYTRLNVEQGMQQIALDEWNKMVHTVAHTKQYLQQPRAVQKVDVAVKQLRSKQGTITTALMRGVVVQAKALVFFSTTMLMKYPTTIFTGRSEILEQLLVHFSPVLLTVREHRLCLLHGLGGSGKTQITLKFIGLHRSLFSEIFWIDASSEVNIKQGLEDIAHELRAGETSDDALRWFLTNQEEWLVIFDNADNAELPLPNYLPGEPSHGNIIITSRSPHWRGLSPTSTQEIGNMNVEEATKLMLKTALYDKPPSSEDQVDAHTLVDFLGYHALAITQAGAYISTCGVSIRNYHSVLREDRWNLLQENSAQQTDYGARAVYATFEISFSKLSPNTRIFLQMCSYFHYDSISRANFSKAVGNIQQVSGAEQSPAAPFLRIFSRADGVWSDHAYNKIIRELTPYSLIQNDPKTSTFSIHLLVHACARDHPWAPDSLSMIRGQAEDVIGLCIDTADESMANHTFQRTLLPHIDLLLKERLVGEHPKALWQKFGKVYTDNGRWATCADLQTWILEMNRRTLTEEHPDTLTSMIDLAGTHWSLGQFADAMGLEECALDAQK